MYSIVFVHIRGPDMSNLSVKPYDSPYAETMNMVIC